MSPGAFRFTGNSLFTTEALEALLVDWVNRPTTVAGLTAAADKVASYYRARGYLLTQAYLPEQAFSASGGTVTIRIIEAKVGLTTLEVGGDASTVSKTFVQDLLASHLKPGADVTEYSLDKPILLLRDLAGFDASATVEPGAELGQANVRVEVKAKATFAETSVSLDNYGATAAGAVRAIANLGLSNLTGRGDALSASGQLSDQPGSYLYRLGYNLPLGSLGTRVGMTAARLNYALGKQFTALNAFGKATMLGLNVSQPLVRGRNTNVYGQASLEEKRLVDQTLNPQQKSDREIVTLRVGLAGNFIDSLVGTTGLNAYAINATAGRLKLDAADLALDEGLGGLRTAGAFNKVNLEFQRTQYFNRESSLLLTLQSQLAYKNLNSAEKMSLGGPTGVRAYPAGEGIGDSGTMLSLEYRHQLPQSISVFSEPISVLTFYDYGYVRLNQNGPSVLGAVNASYLGATGVGAIVGRAGNFLIKTHLAWRTTKSTPSTGDADRAPRAWLSAQTWF